ncbi:hypothetical protein NP493_608g02023 [Ridgeia piscesae]|uniref:Uncharacterized protein n=1 Tax=Ridgeia piscesae TaxID=27915 RepID=A0AAD9KU01_RIDPI|nr:hypothetical protein NP493_608g02023 [Ridgeia piscesae]
MSWWTSFLRVSRLPVPRWSVVLCWWECEERVLCETDWLEVTRSRFKYAFRRSFSLNYTVRIINYRYIQFKTATSLPTRRREFIVNTDACILYDCHCFKGLRTRECQSCRAGWGVL